MEAKRRIVVAWSWGEGEISSCYLMGVQSVLGKMEKF